MTIILGINAFHADSSAALLIDGKVISAVEEERFSRIKHSAGFPKQSIKWCLKNSNISITDVDHIGINTDPKANFLKKVFYTLRNSPSPGFILDRLQNKIERIDLRNNIKNLFPDEEIKSEFHFIEHHLTHLASTFFASNYNDSAILSVDGFGDFASSAWGFGKESNITIGGQICFPHSLGIFYTAITQYLGFPNYGDEYKVMGLAPYGNPRFLFEMKEILKLDEKGLFKLNLKYFTHSDQRLNHQWSEGAPVLADHFSNNLIDLLGKKRKFREKLNKRHIDIAASVQSMYEEAFFNLLNMIFKKYKNKNICLAGGCAANSVANGKISKFTKFKKVYIQSAAGDAGGALGVCYSIWNKYKDIRAKSMGAAYLGPSFKNSEIEGIIKSDNYKSLIFNKSFTVDVIGNSKYKDIDTFILSIAKSISEGKVIGWFQGKMEWGPRALGNRSILGDPRRSDMKEILNKKIKRRESFRPFAPSILYEFAEEWFEIPNDFKLEVPYMMQVLQFKSDKRPLVPAVCHVDGSGRLQTVKSKENPRYYKLIKSFYNLTSVPMILNTSFNENEPIVCNPKEALDCFLRTKMDILVLNDFMIARN